MTLSEIKTLAQNIYNSNLESKTNDELISIRTQIFSACSSLGIDTHSKQDFSGDLVSEIRYFCGKIGELEQTELSDEELEAIKILLNAAIEDLTS